MVDIIALNDEYGNIWCIKTKDGNYLGVDPEGNIHILQEAQPNSPSLNLRTDLPTLLERLSINSSLMNDLDWMFLLRGNGTVVIRFGMVQHAQVSLEDLKSLWEWVENQAAH